MGGSLDYYEGGGCIQISKTNKQTVYSMSVYSYILTQLV